MQDVLGIIEKKLKAYPNVRYEKSEDSITVQPTDDKGFSVSLFLVGEAPNVSYAVYYDGWHDEISDCNEALECFAYGLSSECRLIETSRNGEPYKWTMEYKTESGWAEHSTTSLIFTKFWKKKTERYLQNHLISLKND
ncbi:MAG: hypothetical protein KF685_08985 [Acidobacteria bacterium]|nr:hypothetical protein [Acidobacteriota bacterium]